MEYEYESFHIYSMPVTVILKKMKSKPVNLARAWDEETGPMTEPLPNPCRTPGRRSIQ